jgi:glucan phosphoethanolaminetransferase (alkaline phosphatase superfamily)
MDPRLRALSIGIAVALSIYVVNAVRARRLREEYSFLWLLIAAALLAITLWQAPLVALTQLLGGVLPVNILFFAGLVFLVVVSLFYSIRISELNNQVKALAQAQALLRVRVERSLGPEGESGA